MIRAVLCAVGILWLMLAGAKAESRLALVIGNSGYQYVDSLPNPEADARLMAHTLATLGFDVTLHTDIALDELKRAIAQFGRKLRAAGPDATSLFYYAGHGVQVDGRNYMLPVDADLDSQDDLEFEAVDMNRVLADPYQAQPEYSEYAEPPEPHERVRQTFCGT